MARRNDHTPKALKDMAIAAGCEIIAKEGIRGFSARKMARNIGYSVGTLYNVFGDYDDIILHINAVTLERMKTFMHDYTDNATDAADILRRLSHSYASFAQKHPHSWMALYEHHLPPEKSVPEWYSSAIDTTFQPAEQALLALTNNDTLQTDKATKILWAGIHGICILGISGKLKATGAEPLSQMIDTFINIYIAGITPLPPVIMA